jgi:4-diphosphocytidyl-2-C-methyl-D-erythritol kinase
MEARVRFMSDTTRANRSRAMTQALTAGPPAAVAAALYNDFEPAIEARHPIVREIRQAVLAFGAIGALMSGSGPTVFGLFESRNAVDHAHRALERHYPGLSYHVCRTGD